MAALTQERTVGSGISERLARGVFGGLAAGALFIAATMWFAQSTGSPAKGPLLMISTIVLGADAMDTGQASVGMGLAVHAVLSALFGIVFGLVVGAFRTNGTVLIAGTGYGVLLYLVNFKVMAPLAFPVLEMANQPFELVVHIVFGTLLAMAFLSSDSRRGEPILALSRREPS